jgi:hypothetical protein
MKEQPKDGPYLHQTVLPDNWNLDTAIKEFEEWKENIMNTLKDYINAKTEQDYINADAKAETILKTYYKTDEYDTQRI